MYISEYKNIFDNEVNHFYYSSTHNLIINLLGKYSTKKGNLKILDAGCGTGLLAKKMQRFGDVYAIDSSPEAIKFTKKRGIKNVKKASVSDLPFKNNTFDVITSIDVIYHKNVDDRLALKEFSRVLKPRGILIIKVPAFQWLKGHHDVIVETKRRYTNNELVKMLQKEHLVSLKTSYFFFTIFPLVVFRRFLERFTRKKYTSEVESLPFLLNKTLFYLTSIESQVLGKFSLPFGVSLIAVAQKKT